MRVVTVAERRARLARRHLLAPGTQVDDVAPIADAGVALHSSDPVTVHLSAWARMAHPSLEAVDAALCHEHSVVRHHAMRRTLWVMTPPVARSWCLGAHGGDVFDRSGNAGPTLWVDGEIVGAWVQRKDGTLAHALLEDVSTSARRSLERQLSTLRDLFGDTRHSVRFPAPIQRRLLDG
ncbi:MAG: crosslink repair DNA glycosylase YcaQ family protein [Ilumatobacteraceae bacterium]